MDIYRFFHPHYNPRLVSTALRQIEIIELQQVASELSRALKRGRRRLMKKPVPPIMPEHFDDVIKAIDFVDRSLQTISDAHPGDTEDDLRALAQERAGIKGWETWVSLLMEQLNTKSSSEDDNSDDIKEAV